MDEPTWAAGLRASTEVLIQKLSAELPKNAGAVAIERVLTRLEPDHLNGIAQVLIDAATEEKKGLCCLNWRHGRLRAGVV